MPKDKRKAGRQQIAHHEHPDRYAIILYDALMRFGPLVNNFYSSWFAARAAVLATRSYGWIVEGPSIYTSAPNDGVAGSRLRKRPVKPALAGGYHEVTIRHSRQSDMERHVRTLADRVRKTHGQWLGRPAARTWLRAHSYGCARSIFGQVSPDMILKRHLETC